MCVPCILQAITSPFDPEVGDVFCRTMLGVAFGVKEATPTICHPPATESGGAIWTYFTGVPPFMVQMPTSPVLTFCQSMSLAPYGPPFVNALEKYPLPAICQPGAAV